ncbi:MAG TPA: hypothetical protein VK327_06125 [Candidatus Paceibacterota bacterium]|nr:hypothetical protein [Candidatus Paceibacterota bacterium]
MQTESNYELDNSFCPRWIKWLALIPLVALVGYLVAYSYAWRLRGLPLRMGAIQLRNLHRAWVKDDSPMNPIITNYVVSTSDRYFIWTNHYSFAGTNFESQFGLETSEFAERGFLVISRDGRLVWIDKKAGPELVAP